MCGCWSRGDLKKVILQQPLVDRMRAGLCVYLFQKPFCVFVRNHSSNTSLTLSSVGMLVFLFCFAVMKFPETAFRNCYKEIIWNYSDEALLNQSLMFKWIGRSWEWGMSRWESSETTGIFGQNYSIHFSSKITFFLLKKNIFAMFLCAYACLLLVRG